MSSVEEEGTPTFSELADGITALAKAAKRLRKASAEIETAKGASSSAQLLAEEARDVLVRVEVERGKLASTLPGLR